MTTLRSLAFAVFFMGTLVAAQDQAAPPDLSGVYRAIASDATLEGGLRNAGAPEEIALLPAAAEQAKSVDLTQDPEKLCQPIGPFRMMARLGTAFEIAYARGAIVMLFEDVSHGHIRTVHLNRPLPTNVEPAWHGHSVARWERGTLVIETAGFNDRTWLNAAGAQHTSGLRLTERLTPALQGRYLRYEVTAEDAGALAKPYTYTRYFEKTDDEIREDVCES
jgi:hypothetical protein